MKFLHLAGNLGIWYDWKYFISKVSPLVAVFAVLMKGPAGFATSYLGLLYPTAEYNVYG
jgi:hypothetical protein